MAKILVTGGAGYIGSHVCKLLKTQGHEPIVYDNLSRGFKEAVKWGQLIQGDLHETGKLKTFINNIEPDAIMHFAAFAYVGESVENPKLYQYNNVDGSLSLLKAIEETNTSIPLIFSSTCATYGNVENQPIKEDSPQNPINPYGQSKLDIEKALLGFTQKYPEFQFCALRYFNAAGADPEGEIGESHNPEPHIIPNTIKAALGLGPQLKIFGNNYPTPDGTCIRDFIHVIDLAQAHILLLENLIQGKPTEQFYNIGNTKGFSLLEIIKETEKALGKKVPFEFAEKRIGDPAELIGSSEKFTQHFSWKPEHSNIKTIIETAASWLKNPHY